MIRKFYLLVFGPVFENISMFSGAIDEVERKEPITNDFGKQPLNLSEALEHDPLRQLLSEKRKVGLGVLVILYNGESYLLHPGFCF